MRYKLDNQTTIEISDNTTLTGLSHGQHNLTVYATDIAGNIGVSETINFTIALAKEPEPFPTTLVIAVAASVVVVGIGLTVYFKKHNHSGIDKHSEIEQPYTRYSKQLPQ